MRLLVIASLVLVGCGEAAPPVAPGGVRVEVSSLIEDPSSGVPVLGLSELDGLRGLRIWIGSAEAESIARELQHQHGPRPNTHDLLKRVVDEAGAAVREVVITDLRDGVYYARVHLEGARGTRAVDARPSDAIALALRTRAPILVSESLLEAMGAREYDDDDFDADPRQTGDRQVPGRSL